MADLSPVSCHVPIVDKPWVVLVWNVVTQYLGSLRVTLDTILFFAVLSAFTTTIQHATKKKKVRSKFPLTSNFGVVGHSDATLVVVRLHGDLPGAARAVPIDRITHIRIVI